MRRTLHLLTLALLFVAGQAMAVDRPTTKAGGPTSGKKYILVNAYNPTGYMSRTTWDGALYFLGESDSNYANYAMTAQQNDDGTWSFYLVAGTAQDGTDSLNYMALPDGYCNVNVKSVEPAKWTLADGDIDGYYKLIAGEGNTAATIGLAMHLNAGGQYFVISEETNGGTWYPDYAGGTIAAENDYGYEVDENGRAVMADQTSENWQFLEVESVEDYMARYAAYNSIKSFEDDYVGLTDYEDGFQATDDAVLAIYNSSDFDTANDPTTIANMISKKVALYELLEEAKAIEDADDDLTAAIATAQSEFASKTSADDVQAAIDALQQAIDDFKQGLGDITSKGTNMSFEDLSAQGGSETSSVAAPPVGWNAYVAGTQVTTAAEVKAAGIANWFGVNSDCNGEGKDGNVGFGLWTSGVPEFEISQTIEGLENGTYVVSAGLMVGANSSGSRRTTQRIFGNLNSTYFGSEGEYDEDILGQDEVFAYAGLTEPLTDTELQPLQVRAYVYDGTLTFGLRTNGDYTAAFRTSANGAGGDGWFKVDNFTIMSEGYNGDDAAAVANHYIDAVNQLLREDMQEELETEATTLVGNTGAITADTEQATINKAITDFYDLYKRMDECVEAYDELEEAVNEAYEAADEYEYYSGYSDYVATVDAIYENLEDKAYTAEEATEKIQELKDALEELKMTGLAVGEYLDIIQNGSFEDLSAQGNANSNGQANPPAGWDLYLNGTKVETLGDYTATGASMNWCAINQGDNIDVTDDEGNYYSQQPTDGSHLWGIWAQVMPEVQLSQTFTGLPAGTYTLSADVMVQWDWAGDGLTTQRLFANDYVVMWGTEDAYASNLPEDAKAAKAQDEANAESGADDLKLLNYAGYANTESYGVSGLLRPMSLTFGVDESGELTIGFRTNNIDSTGSASAQSGKGWFKVDHFQLHWDSEDVPSAITAPQTSANATLVGQTYFTVDGRQISKPQAGITIVKNLFSDGTVRTTKVLK